MRIKPHVWIIIIGSYILLQFLWWADLINSLYQENIGLKILLNPDLQTVLEEEASSKTLMVYSETAVFAILSILGFYFLYRSNKREREYIERQNNFFLSITHELKTPLSGIKLRLQTLLSRKLEAEKQTQLIKQTLENNNRLEELIEAILYTKSLDNKDINLNKSQSNLSQTLDQIIERFKRTYPAEKHHLLNYQSQTIAIAHDSTAISLIVNNLLDNAFKYSKPEENGEVTLRAWSEHKATFIQIEDQGNIIPKEERQKIFQKFYRIGSEKTRTSKGTGLGLYIVKTLCKLHGIKIKVHNKEKGNVFTLQL